MSMYPKNEELEVFGKKIMFPAVDEITGKFTNGDFTDTEKPASFIPAETMNLIIDNLSELIKACGKEPNEKEVLQLTNLITSDKRAKSIMQRDIDGRARIENPIHDKDIVNKEYLMQKTSYMQEFTFIVDSNDKLKLMYDCSQDGNLRGNDFSRILVKAKNQPYNFTVTDFIRPGYELILPSMIN